MSAVPAALKKTTKISRKRTNSATQEQLTRKRRVREMNRQSTTIVTSMKENCVKMQEVSIGLPRLQPMQLACKENVVLSQGGTALRPRKTLVPPPQVGTQLEVNGECLSIAALPTPQPEQTTTFELARPSTSAPGESGSAAVEQGTIMRGDQQQHQQQEQCYVWGPASTSPIPSLKWADSQELWREMRAKDVSRPAPEAELRLKHPSILPNMRIILLDWLMEVCEEYRLHRETYYLAVEMFDRFMDTQTGVEKEQLQLIGVTCLFVAAKIEEIYPPKVSEFAYVTDGACDVASLLNTELIIMKVLKWKLHHFSVTVNTWVNTYMQLTANQLRPPGTTSRSREFEVPAYSGIEFTRVMQLLDLCTLDLTSRQFGSSVLAATALYLASERTRAHFTAITGLELSDIQLCAFWMQPCAMVLSHKGSVSQKSFRGVTPHDTHNIQTHDSSIMMLEDALELRRSQEQLPAHHLPMDCSVFMTPPRQLERRCLAPLNVTNC